MRVSFTEVGWRGISGLRTQAYGVAFNGEIVRLLVGGGAYFIYFKGELIRLEGDFDGINYISRSQNKFFLSKRGSASASEREVTPVLIVDDSGCVDGQIEISGPCSKILVDSHSRVWVGYSDGGSLPIPERGSFLSGFESASGGYDFPGVVCWNESGAVSWRMKDHGAYSDRFLHCHVISICEDRVLAMIDQGNSMVSIDMNGGLHIIETPVLAPLGVAAKEGIVAFLGKYELTRGRGYRDREAFIFEMNGGSINLKEVRSLKVHGSDVPGTPRDVISFEDSIFMHFGDKENLHVMRLE